MKQRLRQSTDAAPALGVFGVPAFRVDERLFWGQDALPMLRAYLAGDPWFTAPTGTPLQAWRKACGVEWQVEP